MKNKKLNQWLWKWHFIAGLIAVPFVLVLSITGCIYLFKDDVESTHIAKMQTIKNTKVKQTISFQEQLTIANNKMGKPITEVIIPTTVNESTEFINGKFSKKQSLYVNPYTGEVTGKFSPKDTWMYTIRKLHGELLTGKVGTKLVELVACWVVVLILTGLYIWFPFKWGSIKGMFTIRTNKGKRMFFRDMHAVTGFWISMILLLAIAGGLPWTDIFGGGYKKIQKLTNSDYPTSWKGIGLSSTIDEKPLTLDEMFDIANSQNLAGSISIGLPKDEKKTFSVSNKSFDLEQQKMLHFDQYSGQLIKAHSWSDVGVMRRARSWVMAFHQGQLGNWNWWLMFTFSILLAVASLSAIISYSLRKPLKDWGIPKVPTQFKVGNGIVSLIVLLGLLFPLFGLSLVLIWVGKFLPKFALKDNL